MQLIILRLRNFFSYFGNTLYIITLKTHITSYPLQIYCLIELIRILVNYWVVSSPLFPLHFQIVKNRKFWEFWCCVVSRKRSLVILGLDGLLIVLYLLANLHYVHEVWILFLLNYWRSIHKEIVEWKFNNVYKHPWTFRPSIYKLTNSSIMSNN